MKTDDTEIDQYFGPHEYQQWMTRAEKMLKGKTIHSLSKNSYEGVVVKALYTQPGPDLSSHWPDQAPFHRGWKVLDRRASGWDIRPLYDMGSLADVSANIEEDLGRGVRSIWLKIDSQDSGEHGLEIRRIADLESVLKSVDLRQTPIILDCPARAWPLFAALLSLSEKRGMDPSQLSGAVHFNPIRELAETESLVDRDRAFDELSTALNIAAAKSLELGLISHSSLVFHRAGANAVQELGLLIASLVETMRELEKRGHNPGEIAKRSTIQVALGRDLFMGIAKIRALRGLWNRVLEACQVAPEDRAADIHSSTSSTTQSRYDPWVNMLRATSEAFAATVAGSDALTVLPFDRGLGQPSSLGRRMASHLQILLEQEAQLGRVADAAGGSWFVEDLTSQLSQQAWAYFQKIEEHGGLRRALTSGHIHKSIRETVQLKEELVNKRKEPIVGISEFAIRGEELLVRERHRETATTLGERRTISLDWEPLSSEGRLSETQGILEGQGFRDICEHLRSGDPEQIDGLGVFRYATMWEDLRAVSDAFYKKSGGARPLVYLLKIGALAKHKGRAAFAERLLLSGGFETVNGEPGDSVKTLVEGYKRSGTTALVICGSDEQYQETAVVLAAALKVESPVFLGFAGSGGPIKSELEKAGVSHFISLGCPGIEILRDLQNRMGLTS
jgi:methylmalonyl-CoA mutase